MGYNMSFECIILSEVKKLDMIRNNIEQYFEKVKREHININQENWKIRMLLAEKGYYLEQFINDRNSQVREAAENYCKNNGLSDLLKLNRL